MTPSIEQVSEIFATQAQNKNIDLESVDPKWIANIINCTQICEFKSISLVVQYIQMALDRIPTTAYINNK